jgi:hypothetical protein
MVERWKGNRDRKGRKRGNKTRKESFTLHLNKLFTLVYILEFRTKVGK